MTRAHPRIEAGQEEAAAAEALPAIQLGEHRISRLVAGWNPIGGRSHTTLNMARFMREYFTVERCFKFAFESIKPTDGVIVGMFPVYCDEVHDNAVYTRNFGAA